MLWKHPSGLSDRLRNRELDSLPPFATMDTEKGKGKIIDVGNSVILIEDDDEVVGGPPPTSSSFKNPIEGLNGVTPAPFLKKLFRMIEDPETGKLISWAAGKRSLVVWDVLAFSAVILYEHFKNNNFSNFYKQLNIYVSTKILQLSL